ncbi:MAG: hypothetical protein WBP73_08220 [Terriglobales bacterium]
MPITGLFTAGRNFDYHTFRYRITPTSEGLEVNFSHSLFRSAKPYFFAVFFCTPGLLVLRWFGVNIWSVFFASPFLGIAALLMMAAIFSDRRTTMWLSPAEIKVRQGMLGGGEVRTFPIAEVAGFGLGAYGHTGSSVLKFEVGNKWITLVGGNDLEVGDFLRDLEAHGWKVPQ